MRWLTVVTGLATFGWHGHASATPKEYALTIEEKQGKPVSNPKDGLKTDMTEPDGVKLKIECKDSISCSKVKLTVTTDAVQPTPASVPPATDKAATFTLAAAPSTIRVVYESTELFTLHLNGGAPDTEKPPATGSPPATGTARTLATTVCQRMTLTPGPREVFVTPLGTTLTPLPQHFAESEILTVIVVGDINLVDTLEVRRKSSIRVVTGNILGDDPAARLDLHGARRAPDAPCKTRPFTVGDFAAGTGEVEIRANVGADPVVLGSFQLLVDPAYLGMFSIGAMWTPLLSPDFGVATRNGQQVITTSEAGDRRLAYAFMFTPFLWERLERNVRRPMRDSPFYYHINPSAGFLLNDPLNNALLGVTLDLQSAVLFTGGALFSHVKELDGVELGDEFAGAAADLPTHKRWKIDWFVGVSLDARVAVKLLRTVLGAASGS